jgi:simple sugar transport system ATP-binding protein
MTNESGFVATTPPLLEVRGVTKRFGGTLALDSIDMTVTAGMSHALAGRNGAGKSTLVSILTGLVKPDQGEVLFDGEPAPDPGDLKRWRKAIACVYQHSMTIPDLTVAENLFLNDYPEVRGRIDWRRINREATDLLEYWGLDVGVGTKISNLSVGNRQLVEIARALRGGSRLVVLDEPTAQLETKEISQLFGHMDRLKQSGVTFLYISHHLQEIYEACSWVTVFRDGRLVESKPVAELDRQALVTAMVGTQERTKVAPRNNGTDGTDAARPDAVLEVRDLTIGSVCDGITFSVHPGECVGLAGLGGSGKLEVTHAIAGLIPRPVGTVLVAGKDVAPGRVDLAIEAGLGYVPEDRRARGYSGNLTTEENATASITRQLSRLGWISSARRRARATQLIVDYEIVPQDPNFMTANMSGGNQQKTVVARALATDPLALMMVAPTSGVDIAAKEALFDTIRSSTAGVLLVSDELDELAICDRVLVMFDGRIVTEMGQGRTDRELVAAMEGLES